MRAPICASLGLFQGVPGDISPAFCVTGGIERMLFCVLAAILLVPGLVFGAPPELPKATGITTVSSSAQNLSLKVSLPMTGASSLLMQAGRPYIPAGASGSVAVGEPDVPVFAEWVLIPNGTRFSLRIDPGKPVVYGNIDIPPVQPPKLNSALAPVPDLTINTITYSTDGDFPGILAEAGPVKNVRGQQCAIMRLYPYQYNPVTRRLSVYPDLEVSLQFEGNIRPASRRLKNEVLETMLKRLTVNGDVVLSAQARAVDRLNVTGNLYPLGDGAITEHFGDGQTGGCDYLIICDPDFEIPANRMAGWKRLSGFRTKVVTTDTTGASAANIERFIDKSQEDWLPAPSYVLLLGDAEYVPCCYG